MPKAKAKATVPQSQVGTRAKNKMTHPGKVIKDSQQQRRTKAEVQQEKDAKAQAKKDLAEARQQSINRAAEFEHADIANEDMVDATPRPIFTPKPRPLTRNQKKSSLTPFADSTDIEVSDDLQVDETPFIPGSNSSVDADASAVESDGPPPPSPAKKKKAKITQKARVDAKKIGETANRKRRVDDAEDDVPRDSDEEQPQEPKPKKTKVKMRDEINVATTKILEIEKKGNKYAEMVNSMGSSGKPASKVPSHSSQFQAVGGRQLKREGAIADIEKLVGGQKLNKEGAIADITKSTADSSTRAEPGKKIRADPGNNNSDVPPKRGSAINEWASAISVRSKSTLQGPKSTSSRTKSIIPSLTTGGASRLSAPSVLTDNIKIITSSHPSSDRDRHQVKVKAESQAEVLYLSDEGGLSDNDELGGKEREFAINSPPKGKKRITSEQLVSHKSSNAPGEPAHKKPRNEELPHWIEAQWFRHTFVTTYMAFVGQTINPWDVPVKQSITVMQKIWDATSSFEYAVTTDTAVYHKTVQRLADSWRNIIGSTGIAILLAFFDSQPELQNSDKDRVEFAKYYLENLRFLYKDSDTGNDKKACESNQISYKWKGLFRSPFVLQTFAAHLGAIEGSTRVPGLHGPDKPTPGAIGGLALSAASMERALTLVATGTLTVAMAHGSKGKAVTLPRTLNLSTGKESMRQTGFSDAAWGKATRGYATSIRSLTNTKLDAIITAAQVFVKPTRAHNKTDPTEIINVDEDNERACLVDNSDSDSCNVDIYCSSPS